MNENQVKYARQYLDLDSDHSFPGFEEIIAEYLFYQKQLPRQEELISKYGHDWKSDASSFSAESKEVATLLHSKLNCKPKSNLLLPAGKEFAVFLGHDVDLLSPSLRYRLAASTLYLPIRKSNPFRLLLKRENPYRDFARIMELERRYEAKSTFFFLTSRDSRDGRNYLVDDYATDIGMIYDNGFEVALHGGIDAYHDPIGLGNEKRMLERATNKPVVGYRSHCLRFVIPNTWLNLASSGFKYDNTFGYNDIIGFRNGLCFPFQPYNVEKDRAIDIWELSANILDKTLFYYMGLDMNAAYECSVELIDAVRKVNGVVSLSWHSHLFDGIYWRSYERLYEKLLKYCHQNNGWMCSGVDLISKIKGT